MGRKLEANGLFESSRMILPEHREAYLQLQHNEKIRPQPVLDEQEWQQIEELIVESYVTKVEITIVLFEPVENFELQGVVIAIDQQLRRIKLDRGSEWQWVRFEEVMSAFK